MSRYRDPDAVVKAACLESRIPRARTPLWPSSFKDTKYFFHAHSLRFNIMRSIRDREVACSASDSHGPNFDSCIRSVVSYHSSHHRQDYKLQNSHSHGK